MESTPGPFGGRSLSGAQRTEANGREDTNLLAAAASFSTRPVPTRRHTWLPDMRRASRARSMTDRNPGASPADTSRVVTNSVNSIAALGASRMGAGPFLSPGWRAMPGWGCQE